MTHSEFIACRDELTERLAQAFESKLREMGDDVRQISWFSAAAPIPLDAYE